jgi:hypothetical protein
MNKDSMRKKKLEEMVKALIAGDSNTAAKALTEYLQSKTRSMIVSEEYEDVEARGEEGDDEFDFDSEEGGDDEFDLDSEEGGEPNEFDEEPGEDEDFEGGDEDFESDDDFESEGEPNEFDDEISGEGEDLEFGDESDEEPRITEGVKKAKVSKIKYSGKGKAKMKKHSNAAPHLGTATKKVKFGTGKPRKVK